MSYTHRREYVEWVEEAKRPRHAPGGSLARSSACAPADRTADGVDGTLAASVTPLRDSGAELDEGAFEPLVDFFVDAGLDGVLVLGTAGEGILLEERERRLVADLFLQAADNRLQVAVQCGAQTTAETVALAAHAAEVGADAVVVIGPPYFRLDERAQHAHFLAAALACAPLPFYVYEFESTSGYAVAPAVLERLRDDAPNLAGLKVSDTPFERFSRYLLPNLDIFVGPEALIHEGLAAGAVGAVSALASAFPREVAAVVRDPTLRRRGASRRAAGIRRALPQAGRSQAPARPSGRSGSRGRAGAAARAHDEERDELDAWHDRPSSSSIAVLEVRRVGLHHVDIVVTSLERSLPALPRAARAARVHVCRHRGGRARGDHLVSRRRRGRSLARYPRSADGGKRRDRPVRRRAPSHRLRGLVAQDGRRALSVGA